jgi:hypothetical protein
MGTKCSRMSHPEQFEDFQDLPLQLEHLGVPLLNLRDQVVQARVVLHHDLIAPRRNDDDIALRQRLTYLLNDVVSLPRCDDEINLFFR